MEGILSPCYLVLSMKSVGMVEGQMEDVEVRESGSTALLNQFTKDSHQKVEEGFIALQMTE